MSKAILFLIVCIFTFSSCSYEIIKEKDTTGKVYRQRFYKDAERQQRYFDRRIFEVWYKHGNYAKTSSLRLVGDSVVISDSMKFHIRNYDSSFSGLFFKGIISGNVFDSVAGNRYTLTMTNWETGEVMPSHKIYDFVVYGFKVMDYFNIPYNRMRIKFTAAQATWWIEIESQFSKKDCTLKDFIDKSHLTFIHTQCCEI